MTASPAGTAVVWPCRVVPARSPFTGPVPVHVVALPGADRRDPSHWHPGPEEPVYGAMLDDRDLLARLHAGLRLRSW